jgi:hypothetical protein
VFRTSALQRLLRVIDDGLLVRALPVVLGVAAGILSLAAWGSSQSVSEEASVTGLDGELEQFNRFWESADGGDVNAMVELADLCDGEMRKDWLRRAGDGGDRGSPHVLANELAEEERLVEAALWYQRAYEVGHRSDAAKLSEVLLGLDRLDEAERWARRAVEEHRGSLLDSDSVRALVHVLDRQGKSDEAERLRWQAGRFTIGPGRPLLLPAVLVAVTSVAVVPFVKALMSKAGENSYGSARALVRWLFRRGQVSERGYRKDQLLVVEDPDPKLSMAIWLGTDTPDERLRALKDFDVDTVATDPRRREGARGVRIQWDEASQSWKALDQ